MITCLLGLAAYSGAAPSTSGPSSHTPRGKREIQWEPCGDLGVKGPTKLECGSLTVPLDYTDPSSGETLDLQILKAPAPNQPSKGSVFFNFGGPGGSGIPQMSLMGSTLSVYVKSIARYYCNWANIGQKRFAGGSYDIVNVVPR